jgi:hypothetical protein
MVPSRHLTQDTGYSSASRSLSSDGAKNGLAPSHNKGCYFCKVVDGNSVSGLGAPV